MHRNFFYFIVLYLGKRKPWRGILLYGVSLSVIGGGGGGRGGVVACESRCTYAVTLT